MTSYSFLSELSESKMFPTSKSLDFYSRSEMMELTHMYICAFRIMLLEGTTSDWMKQYIKRSIHWGNFEKWKSDGNDFYIMNHVLNTTNSGMSATFSQNLMRWLKAASLAGKHDMEAKRLFVRLDTDLSIKDSSLRSIRRLVMDWDDLSKRDKRLTMTRLLQKFRVKASKSEILFRLDRLAHAKDLEIKGVCNPDTGEGCYTDAQITFSPYSFLAGLTEDASSGSTCAASIATVPGALGAGFDPNGDTGIYPKKSKKKTIVLKR